MRVLFLTLYPDAVASPRYRVSQFIPYLEAHGVTCRVASPLTDAEYRRLTGPGRSVRALHYHLRETPRRLRQLLSARRYDVVVLQKSVLSAYVWGAAELARACARRLVYDIDDAVHLAPPHPLRRIWRLAEDRGQIPRLFRSADLVLAGNDWLAAAANAAGARRAEVFPTVVDTARFAPADRPPVEYRIGWMGSPSTTGCLQAAADALCRLRDAELCLVGADPGRVPCPGALVKAWDPDAEVAELQRFAVGIMPLPDTDWNRGKCALKALQYMACGVACVASPVGAALDLIEHEANGLLAGSSEEWAAALERLRDPALRRRLGQAGRETVEARYSLKAAAPRLLQLLESVA